MINFKEWRENNDIEISELNLRKLTKEEFSKCCLEYFSVILKGSLKTFYEHQNPNLTEAVETSRYAIEVNYRTTSKEALEGFAKISLGYVSAALKNHGFHTKHVFTEKPVRLMVSSRNWDDGEWCGIVTWHPEQSCFVLSKGFYNKERRTVSVQSSKKCAGDSAADITKDLHNLMHHVKGQPDKHLEKLKPVPLKRGPKR